MSERDNKKKTWIPIVILSAVIVVLTVIIICLLADRKTGKPEPDNKSGTETVKNEGSISVPGYESLELKADSEKQNMVLPNPPQNNCLFEISLYLSDGTLLWKSESIRPGEESEPIILNKALPAGTYDGAYLHYDCFTDDAARTPLNSAETILTLNVK